jgi:hypothetical protein
MTRKLQAFGIGATLLGLVVGTISVASAGSDITSAQTLHLAGKITQHAALDLGTPGFSQGDEFLISGPLFNQGGTQQVGHFGGYIVVVKTGPKATGEGLVTFRLSGGQITFQGLQPFVPPPALGPPFQSAVNGGTGVFQNARGQATVTETGPGTFAVTVRLIP